MSVLKSKRSESRAEYIHVANQIYVYTINFVVKLSARYSRVLAESTANIASSVIEHCEESNSIFPSNEERKLQRESHLLEARAALTALDNRMAVIYEILSQNPQGCFSTANGNPVDASSAKDKLENLSQVLGELIDKENGILTNLIKTNCVRQSNY